MVNSKHARVRDCNEEHCYKVSNAQIATDREIKQKAFLTSVWSIFLLSASYPKKKEGNKFHNHAQLLKVKTSGGPLDNQTWHTNGWPQQKLPKFGFRIHTTALRPMEQSSILSARTHARTHAHTHTHTHTQS